VNQIAAAATAGRQFSRTREGDREKSSPEIFQVNHQQYLCPGLGRGNQTGRDGIYVIFFRQRPDYNSLVANNARNPPGEKALLAIANPAAGFRKAAGTKPLSGKIQVAAN
jgi:hypothetical protein